MCGVGLQYVHTVAYQHTREVIISPKVSHKHDNTDTRRLL